MTFRKWISYFKDVTLPIGDIARDIIADEGFPNNGNKAELHDYIDSHLPSSGAINAFDTAWDFYKATGH